MKHFKEVVLKIMKYNKYTVKCVYQNYMVDDFSNLNSIDLDQAQTVLQLSPLLVSMPSQPMTITVLIKEVIFQKQDFIAHVGATICFLVFSFQIFTFYIRCFFS